MPEKETQTAEYVPAGPVKIKSAHTRSSVEGIRLVILESPLTPYNEHTHEEYIGYARKCAYDSLLRNEAPFLSHLLYTQPGVLHDYIPEERKLGIEAGLAWGRVADATIVYVDYGVSRGMKKGIDRARKEGRTVELREFAGATVSRPAVVTDELAALLR
jgi:hypothetical protein